MVNRYVVVCPQFVKGSNLKYLSDYVISYLKKLELHYYTVGYTEPIERGKEGFYNFDTWMLHELKNTKYIIDTFFSKNSFCDDNFIFIFIDYWSPSAAMIKLHTVLNRHINCKFIGWYHGSSTLKGDYFDLSFPMEKKTFEFFEISLNGLYDQIWAGSDYFISGIPVAFKNRIIKIGEPFNVDDYIMYRSLDKKKYDVVINARLDKDKIDFESLNYILEKSIDRNFLIISPVYNKSVENVLLKYNNVKIIYSMKEDEYLKTLAECKIILSLAKQEGWGYAVMKAVTVGCIPVLPDTAVYPELYEREFLYGNLDEALMMIDTFVGYYPIKTFIPSSYGLENFTFNENGLLKIKRR